MVASATAEAGTTAAATFSKTGTNLRNDSVANSASGAQGTAQPGDTIKWALNYKNTTGADATVGMTDPIASGQTYVPNSLQTPPNLSGTVSGSTVTVNGTVLSGATASQSPNFSAAAVTFSTPGGDGYSVEGFGNSIYTVFHHNASSTVVFCATLTNQVCQGWPGYSSYVSPTAGTPLGTGPVSTFGSDYVNGSFIAGGRLYWSVTQNGATGTNVFGMQCLDLTSLVSCGYNQLGTTTVAGYALSGDGIAAADGNYYYMDNNGSLQCVTPTATSCGAVDVAGTTVGHGSIMEVGTYGRYVYVTYDSPTAPTAYLTCFDTTTHSKCANFPKPTGPFSGAAGTFVSEVMPVVSSTGAFQGACAILHQACFDPSGNAIADPWTLTAYAFSPLTNAGFGTGVLSGTKYYTGHGTVVDCYDFAQPLVGGKVQPCAAFVTHPPDVSSYTVRALSNLPGCMASNGDGAQISVFNAVTGAPCASASQTLALDPSVYYCDGQPGHIDSWGAVTLPGLSASDYAGATLTLFGADGTALPAWTNVPFPASGAQSIDISSIPVTGNTAKLTAQVNLAAVTNTAAVNASRVRATWIGDPVQVCYQTTIDPVPCLTTVPVSNTANAVTTAGAVTDGPAGNSSGPAIFNVSPSAAQCMLHLAKIGAPDPAKPGTTVTYTITVHNTGTMDYLASDPATFTDDITDVLTDSSYNAASLTASAGTASYNATTDVISWSGPLAANATATITYTVVVNDPDAGDHSMFNRVVTPPGTPSNCAAASTDPACGAVVQVPDLKVSKSSNPADGATVVAGQVITYTLTFQNVGQGTAATDYTDDLTRVLDDGSVTSTPVASNANLTVSAISNGTFTVTGGVPAGAIYTVTYQVTVGPDGQRGDNDMVNFLFPTGSTPPTACVSGDPLCTEHKIPQVSVAKTSDPVDGASVASGDDITYTLTIQNTGTATGGLDYVDYLAGVLDDATITTAATASNANVAVGTVSNDQLPISGTIPAGATYTVTYKVTVKPYAQQGDHNLLNYVAPPGTNPPSDCLVADNCVVHPIPHLSIDKGASTTERPAPGDTVSYTVVVTNDGGTDYTAQNPASMTDDLSDVLDDATYNGDAAATLPGTPAVTGSQLSWSGALAAGQSVTITYSVTYTGSGSTVMVNTACVPKHGTDPHCDTVSVPAALISPSKSVDPADGSTVVAGQVLTYTLTFANSGQGAGDINYTEDLSKVLDDATITDGPTASNPALTIGAVTNGSFQITGTVPATTAYTVTVKVTVKPDGQRGDDQLDNFLVPTGTTPPAQCAAGDPMCTHNPVPEIIPTKSVDPTSGSTVHSGDVLTYTLSFHNVGAATGSIDYVDHLADVLDDATVTSAPAASSTDLAVSPIGQEQFEVTGTVPVDATYTVTYQVTIKPEGQRGNDEANNFVTRAGEDPPSSCTADNPLCTHNPMPDVVSWKTVDPASGTPVVPGQSLTYTLHFQNQGTAEGTVGKVDDITQAMDDATVASQPASSDTALTATAFGADNRSAITGTLAAGQTVTVTYALKIDDPDRGDSILANFLQKPTDPPPTSPDCTPTDAQLPDCTANPVGDLAVSKTVNPKNFSKVEPGDTLTYTLTFHNTGKGTYAVDYTDRMAGVLDDAALVSGPDASDSALTAGNLSGGSLRITGTLDGGQTVRVTYEVKVKAYDAQGDHELDNFLQPTGARGVDSCVTTDPLCTDNPVPSAASGGGGGTANTGSNTERTLLLGALLLGAGGLLSLLGVRRRRSPAS
jgi:uncharacterized repeat protein (TIGR01451 family)/fimbrial isopeptide formation D2 family protein